MTETSGFVHRQKSSRRPLRNSKHFTLTAANNNKNKKKKKKKKKNKKNKKKRKKKKKKKKNKKNKKKRTWCPTHSV
ncbi:hypothetical protein EYF80_000974 [Liparis tanakae]|uniref:Uncharacterized protein n=1 Tax=Liparis tanakae TaxID=230148 RepID=A0A4Z2JHB1_9TELE|nr:hypothetical protein EYF80_000974 [Liparis tanakae]